MLQSFLKILWAIYIAYFSEVKPVESYVKPINSVIIESVSDTTLISLIDSVKYVQFLGESSNTLNPYKAVNRNNNGTFDYGKYQINDRAWLYPMQIDPVEFMNNCELQERTFEHIIITHARLMRNANIPVNVKTLRQSMYGIYGFINNYKHQ